LTGQQVLDGVNNTAGLKVKGSLTADGKLQLEATNTNSITVGGTASAAELAQFGLTAGVTAAGTLNTTRSGFATQFDAIRKSCKWRDPGSSLPTRPVARHPKTLAV
jgi:filamentous hemagglutinin family protein